MKKRGISGVVAAILLILLVIAAIIIFWYAARQIISQDSDVGLITSDFKIESATSSDGGYNVRVKRNPGYGNVVKVKLVFENDAGERYTYNYTNPIKQLEIKTIQTGAIDFPNAIKVELYPVILSEKGNELLGPKKDEFWIISCESDADCDNGAYCDGNEACVNNVCAAGTAVDCSGNNLVEIATCNNDPDNNPFTWDYRAAFTSSCDEATDSCTTGSVSLTHSLIIGSCGVSCITDTDCADPNPVCNTNTYTCVPAGIFVSEDGTIRESPPNYVRTTDSNILNVESMSERYRTYIEFDISSINNPAITRVDLRLNVRQILSGVCPIYSLETQPSTLADNNANNLIIFNDISDGNQYLDDSFCTRPGEQIIILGPQAVSDLQARVNAGEGWFGVGIYTNAADRAIIDSSESANGPALIVS